LGRALLRLAPDLVRLQAKRAAKPPKLAHLAVLDGVVGGDHQIGDPHQRPGPLVVAGQAPDLVGEDRLCGLLVLLQGRDVVVQDLVGFVHVDPVERRLALDHAGDGAALGQEHLVVGAGGQRADRDHGLEEILVLIAIHLGAQLIQQWALQDFLDSGPARPTPPGPVVSIHMGLSL
jgi:hypothetical protein